jgi:hypothetical protein
MDEPLATGSRCGRCDSDQLRRAHSRSDLQKLLRRHTGFDRYACSACGHRGWTWGKVSRRETDGGTRAPARAAPAVASPGSTPAGRRLERRDQKLQRKVRLRSWLNVAAALALGILVAMLLQRCGVSAPSG